MRFRRWRSGHNPSNGERMGSRDNYLADTQHIFEELAGVRLTKEAARECHANMAGFLKTIVEWHQAAIKSSLFQTGPENSSSSTSKPITRAQPSNRTQSLHQSPPSGLSVVHRHNPKRRLMEDAVLITHPRARVQKEISSKRSTSKLVSSRPTPPR